MTIEDLAPAAAASEAALAAGTADAYDLGIAALARGLAGREGEAEDLFNKAVALQPDDPSPLVFLAIWRREQGQLRDSALACDRAIALAPGYADAWLERGATLAAGGSAAAARASFEQAARLAPHSARAHAGIASIAAREGDRLAANEHARTALGIEPGNAVARNALASLALEDGRADDVPGLLDPVVATLPASVERSQARSLLGQAATRAGSIEAAYEHFRHANEDYVTLTARAAAGSINQYDFIAAIDAGLAAALPAWGPPLPPRIIAAAAPRHVFLLGYPRSGTTLLENVLASLPGVEALEERPTFAELDSVLLSGDAGAVSRGVQAFALWGEDRLAGAARGYWQHVHNAGISTSAETFLDMDPLKGTRLPFIARMFPDARVIVLRRDPRDVVWSCFRTNFAVTSNTLEFTSLERVARHYDALMRLTDRALQNLPIAALEVDYQRLVREFDTVTHEICAFTGLEWSENLRRFDRTAQERGVGTASATQVRRGLYDGSGQWRPFAEYFEPIMPILAPWIARFGSGD
ncbi:tetratricopeptide repeat-containing sulfotransferase family protein [Parablastomonas sp. CN1-191]|uniref:tetratricopeptide repeat-containing sulfotransferase family protein n=1 Tax=Parablastomonas sp. CN1-191 TaxID=3400908 RepID=UPI003BF889BE